MLVLRHHANVKVYLLAMTLVSCLWHCCYGRENEVISINLDFGPKGGNKVKSSLPYFTKNQKTAAVDVHNMLRRTPDDAANMLIMEWDDELEQAAVHWTNHCNYARKYPEIEKYETSQHVFYSGYWERTPQDAINTWIAGKNYHSSIGPDCKVKEPSCLAFKEIIYWGQRDIGCGIQRCRQPHSRGPLSIGYTIACIYGPKNKDPNGLSYTTGAPCSQCPKEYRHCVNKLCSNKPEAAASKAHSQPHSPMSSAMLILITSVFTITLLYQHP